MNVLVTGARGFIGKNLVARLHARADTKVITFDVQNSAEDLRVGLSSADIVYHLAGVNRPERADEYEIGNADFTRRICALLRELGRSPIIVMSSSIQATLDNPYGLSKRHGEEALTELAAETGSTVHIYRLRNVFGKWSRPNYNSVVATFCHNIANDLPIQISDPNREIDLVYVDDVIDAFLSVLDGRPPCAEAGIPSSRLTLADLAGRIQSFREMRDNLLAPDFADCLNQRLYATYLSYVPVQVLCRQLDIKSDQRGALAEIIKSPWFGQIFTSRTKPAVTRGNHYHNTKTEKFLVVEGEAVIRLRHIESSDVAEYRVHGGSFHVVDIPPGYTHSIENVGTRDMVALFWASEVFDPDRPDTYYVPVLLQPEVAAEVTA